jgi:hypothetical protein
MYKPGKRSESSSTEFFHLITASPFCTISGERMDLGKCVRALEINGADRVLGLLDRAVALSALCIHSYGSAVCSSIARSEEMKEDL